MFIFFILLFFISPSSLSSLSSSHLRNFSQALTSLKLSSSLSPSHLKLTISQAQALRPTPSQPKLDPPPSQSPIASDRAVPAAHLSQITSVLARQSVLLHQTHAGISVASPDPHRRSELLHQTHAGISAASLDPRRRSECLLSDRVGF